MGKFLGFLALLAIDVPVLLLRGFVLTNLWRWFIQPFGAPALTIAWAIGLSMTVGFFTNHLARQTTLNDVASDKKPAWYEASLTMMISSVLTSLVAWGLGAIVHSFM